MFIIALHVNVGIMNGTDNNYYHVKHILGAGRANARKASSSEGCIVETATTSAVSSGENVASHLTIHMNGETAMTKT